MSKAHARNRLDVSNQNKNHHNVYNNARNNAVDSNADYFSGKTNPTGVGFSTPPKQSLRPSVFDRLGTRSRDNATSSGSSHFQPQTDSHVHRNEPLKTHSHRSGHSSSSTRRDGSGHGRSRSLSPHMKRNKQASPSVGSHRSKMKSSSKSSKIEKERQSRKLSPKRKSKTSKSPKSKSNVKSKKVMSSKGKGKIRSSSLSSDESSSKSSSTYSTRSRSRSSSSATHASSSSSSAVSSSTDSSVPSIKLKPLKKDKNRKKMKKKSKSLVSGSVEKLKHMAPSLKRQSLSSSASSKDSRIESSHYKDMKRGGGVGGGKSSSSIIGRRTPDRDHTNRTMSGSDIKRSFSKPMDRDKDSRLLTPDRNYEHISRGKERSNFDDEPRKRRLSGCDNYGGSSDGNYSSHKRSRTVPSPPPKYIKNNVTPPPRRVPPPEPSSSGQKYLPRRDRSPPPRPHERRSTSRDRIRMTRSPPRRPSFDDGHNRRDSRPLSRDRHHGGSSSSNTYDKMGYPPPSREQSRPRDRFAPARPLPPMERGGRIAPKHLDSDRDHGPPPPLPPSNFGLKDRPKDYDSPRPGRAPLLGVSPQMMGNKPGLLSKPPLQNPRMIHEDTRQQRSHIPPPMARHMPMIVKTKEALMERYDSLEQTIKQSRVDMWVDQTLKGNSCMSVEPFEPTEKLPPVINSNKVGLGKLPLDETRTSTPEDIKDKCSSIGSLSAVNAIEPITTTIITTKSTENNIITSEKLDTGKNILLNVTEDLSDFSDDDDDILTRDIVASVLEESQKQQQQQTVNSVLSDKIDTVIKENVEENSNIQTNENNAMNLTPSSTNVTYPSVTSVIEGDNNSNKKQVINIEENISGELDKDSTRTIVTTTTSSLPMRMSYDLRDARSFHSQSQTDDDILERMDFEEISDEDFGEVENKISIVDVLGINWASLLRRDKFEQTLQTNGSVRQRWTSSKVFQHVGLSKKHCGKMLFQQVVDKVKETLKLPEDSEPKDLEKFLETPIQRLRSMERKNLFTNYGLGQHSRAFSARRDMVVRRYLLNLPAKSLLSVDFGNQVSTPIANSNSPQGDVDGTELLKMSVSLFKSF